MLGEMMWRNDPRRRQLILFLRTNKSDRWQPYHASKHSVPDYKIAGGSKGWATFQHLKKQGWQLLPTEQRALY